MKHTLTIANRRDTSTTGRYDGSCSCGLAEWRNHDKATIRERYNDHVQHELGPDAQDRRSDAKQND